MRNLGAFLAATIFVVSAGSAVAQTPSTETWAHVEIGDWIPVTEGVGGSLVLVKPGRSSDHLWARFEFSPAEDMDYPSALFLMEFSCVDGRTRDLQAMFYTEPNLRGDLQSIRGQDWTYPPPQSVGDELLKFACGPS